MIGRRDLIMSGACVAAAGLSYALIPRRREILLAGAKLDDILVRTLPGWTSRDVSDLVAPHIEGSLMSRLYGQTVGRIYEQEASGAEIMMLMAYGSTQNDDLQLHRPEICYPAFGYTIEASQPTALQLGRGVQLPCRRLVATAPDREETILYWSRLGEYLPLDRHQQQVDRLLTAMRGVVADGLLARFSMAGLSPDAAIAFMRPFVASLLAAAPAKGLPALIGSERARVFSGG